ncbi:MAG: methyl-accepting chemotaxis protein [Nitrospirae bacterium]|nr:methyl-accepting chemotaxis protein [Nitrospirota bacterium]
MQPSSVFRKSSFYRFGTNLFLVILLGAIVSATILYVILPKELPSAYTVAFNDLQKLQRNLYLKTYLIYLPIAVFIFIGVVAISLSLTKKIVVPLRSLSHFSRILAGGDFSGRPPVESREMSPLATRLNELIDSYQERLSSVKDAVSKLEAIQGKIETGIEEDDQKKIKTELKNLIGITEEIDRIFEKIRV